MVMTINGKEVCRSTVEYGGEGHEQTRADGEVVKTIGRVIGCVDPLRVLKGDKMQLTAYFDFEKHPA